MQTDIHTHVTHNAIALVWGSMHYSIWIIVWQKQGSILFLIYCPHKLTDRFTSQNIICTTAASALNRSLWKTE